MDIFERAARAKSRFPSPIGDLTVEQLWDLPLVNSNDSRPSLDGVAKAVNRDLKSLAEESFIEVKSDPRRTELELKLEIVKHVIASKIAAREIAEKRAATLARKAKLLDALAAKEDQALAGMSREEIEAEIAALGS